MPTSTQYARYSGLVAAGTSVTTIDGISGAVTLVAGPGISIADNTPAPGDITISATDTTPVTIGPFGSTPNANGLSIDASQVLNMQPADATHPGGVSILTQAFGGIKQFNNQLQISNGTVSAPGLALTNSTNSGLYLSGANKIALAVNGVQAIDTVSSSSGFGNIGIGSSASTSDSFPLLIQRDLPGASVNAQISNPDTSAFSSAKWMLSADSGNNNGEVGLFTAATTLAAYANAMTVRPNGNTGSLSLIGGDLSTGYVSTFTGGDYTATGETQRFNADHTSQFMQSIATPTSPAAGSLKFYNSSDLFTSKTSGGVVSSFAGVNSGDITLGTANGLSLVGQALSLALSSTSTTGALSSTDWNTFNGKQPAGIYITALTGDGTATGPGSAAFTLATVNANVGSFTNASITVNAKGLITAASSGTAPVTSVSVATANGLAGTSSGGSTPALTLSTTITGILQGNGTAISAATTTGSGSVVLATAPTMSNPVVGTQSQGDSSTKAASTAYVDVAVSNAVAGINPAIAVQAATTAASDTSSYTYNNGVSGIGATLTGPTNTALTVDGYTFTALGQRLLVKNDTQSPSGAFNGIYYVTQLQTALLPLILTRTLDYDQPSDINNTGAIPVINGTVNGTTSWVEVALVNIVGTDPLSFTKFTRNPADYLLKANNLSDVASPSTSFNNISPMTTGGDIIYGGASGAGTRLPNGTSGQFLKSNGGTAAPSWANSTSTLTSPTVQIFSSGSGTYTRPTSPTPLYLKIKMVGGGGGGGGGGANGTGGTGTAGNNSTFGTSLLIAAGGTAGNAGHSQGSAGGVPTINSPAIDDGSQIGGTGGGSPYGVASVSFPVGGYGGDSAYGGGGSNDSTVGALDAVGGTGGGGAGGCGGSGAAAYGGAGGGSGAYVEAIIPSPGTTYSYVVGGPATGGTAGTSGTAGSGGASGKIIITEYYQ